METAPLYRMLHSTPLLFGVPPKMALGLLTGSVLLGIVGTVWNWMIGVGVAVIAALVWGGFAWVFSRDRADVAAVLLSVRGIRLSRRLNSFRPSKRRVVFVERRSGGDMGAGPARRHGGSIDDAADGQGAQVSFAEAPHTSGRTR
jgi:hypothetical protein